MGVTITWYPPFPAPQNFTATLQDGGSLEPNTTYYYRVMAVKTMWAYETLQEGEPSVEISITTTDTKKTVVLNWDAVSGTLNDPDGYCVYRRKASQPDYSFYGAWLRSDGTSAPSTTTTSFTDDGTAKTYWAKHGTWAYLGTLPQNMDKNLGRGVVEVEPDADGGTVTIDDIHNAINDTRFSYWDGKTWVLLGYLYFKGSYDVTFNAQEKVIHFLGRLINGNSGANSSVTFGDYDADTGQTARGCTIYFWKGWAFPEYSKTGFYNCKVIAVNRSLGSTYGQSGPFSFAGFSVRNVNSFESINSDFSECSVGPYNSDVKFTGGWVFSFGGYLPGQWTLTEAHDFKCYQVDALAWKVDKISGITCYGGSAPSSYFFHIRKAANGGYYTNFVDSYFPSVGDYPTIYWYGGIGDNPSYIVLKYTLDLTVNDENGNPISGATVKIVDKDGNEVGTLTTDSNGQISQELKWVKLQRNSVAGNYKRDSYPYTYTCLLYTSPSPRD